jgi:hypothetical protein
MIILTLKERQFIDEAVFKFGDEHERTLWRDWKLAHSAVRYDPTDPIDDGIGRMPYYVAEVLTNALTRFERDLQARIASVEISDDEAAVLCNDIGDIHSTAEAIRAAM